MSSDDSITVYFRIVGLYFGSVPGPSTSANPTGDVSVEVQPNPTVEDVTRAVQRKSQQTRKGIDNVVNFAYFPQVKNGTKLLGKVYADYSEPPRTGYTTGPYVLEQDLTGAPQHAFQYYIYDVEQRGGGEPPALRLKNTDNTFVPFNEQPNQQITDGDFVVWRLASIARGANGVGETRLEQRALGLTEQADE